MRDPGRGAEQGRARGADLSVMAVLRRDGTARADVPRAFTMVACGIVRAGPPVSSPMRETETA